ncbi:MAG: hypothetical protein GY811_26825 [Myxococcales bacterium]|nr:hypothetical protein [Myxococcales bacterium]
MSANQPSSTHLSPRRFVVLGVCVGFFMGMVDVLDTMLGGFATGMGIASLLGITLFAALLHAAFGSLIGLALAGVLRLGQRKSARWDSRDGLRWGPLHLSYRLLLAALGPWILALFGGSTFLCLGAFPFGYQFLHFVALLGPLLCIVLGIGTKLAPSSKAARLAL